MDNQDWIPVTVRRRYSKKEAAQAGQGSIQVRDPAKNEKIRMAKLADADAYVDDDLVIQFFDKGSIVNENEALVWNDTLISTEGLGTQTLTKKDKIIVYGDDGEGLPVISVSGTGNKETVIFCP